MDGSRQGAREMKRMDMKINQSISNTLMAGLMLFGVVMSCSVGYETDKANKLVAEGNAAIDEGKKFFADAEEKKSRMLRMDVSHLADARTIANEAIKEYDQAEEKAKAAAGKFEEAGKLKISDTFKEYLTLKVKEYNKRAELIEAAKGIPQALVDSQSRSVFVSTANAATEKGNRLNKEAGDLSDQADKLEKDNPDIFKK